MLRDKRTAPIALDKWRRGLETSSPDGASNAEGEWAEEFVAVEGVEAEAVNKGAPRYRRSQCWRRDLAGECGQKWKPCPILSETCSCVQQAQVAAACGTLRSTSNA